VFPLVINEDDDDDVSSLLIELRLVTDRWTDRHRAVGNTALAYNDASEMKHLPYFLIQQLHTVISRHLANESRLIFTLVFLLVM